jgi:hypothetical protein
VSDRLGLVALAVAVIALIVAAYTVAMLPKASSTQNANKTVTTTTTAVASSPPPNVTISLRDSVTVDIAGLHKVDLGWIYTTGPVVIELRGSGDYEIWFLVDNNYYGNPALAVLDKGNHTVSAYINAVSVGNFNISYRVVG